MADHFCCIVPPHLLEALAQSDDPDVRESATKTLAIGHAVRHHRRAAHTNRQAQHSLGDGSALGPALQSMVPDYLLEHLATTADVDDHVKESAAQSLATSRAIREERTTDLPAPAAAPAVETTQQFHRGVYDAQGQGGSEWTVSHSNSDELRKFLPGKPALVEGQPSVADKVVNEAYENCLKVLEFYQKVFNYNSLDDKNMPVVSSVHVGQAFANAFWHPTLLQMIYGDGNKVLYNFTACLDVIGHEMTHAVTQFNSALNYQDESGALNEHLSDVFGIMVKQMYENKTAEQADWLIGENCLYPGVDGFSLRDMKNPGQAYKNLWGGKDPQPANYKDITTFKENFPNVIQNDAGGVHIFSGVPNRAFVLSALSFGGYSWEKAGKIWWWTATGNRLAPNCTFIQFADVTVDGAQQLFGDAAAKAVRDAWNQVGVVRSN